MDMDKLVIILNKMLDQSVSDIKECDKNDTRDSYFYFLGIKQTIDKIMNLIHKENK